MNYINKYTAKTLQLNTKSANIYILNHRILETTMKLKNLRVYLVLK